MSQEKYIVFPSFNNPVVFKQLNILVDTLPGQILGIWHLNNGKCLQIMKNLIKNKQVLCQMLQYSKTELLICQKDQIIIYDISKQSQREIKCGGIFEQSVVQKKGKYLYGLNKQKKIVMIDLEDHKIVKEIVIEKKTIIKIGLLSDHLVVGTNQNIMIYDQMLQLEQEIIKEEEKNINVSFQCLEGNNIVINRSDNKNLQILNILNDNSYQEVDTFTKEKDILNFYFISSSNLIITTLISQNKMLVYDLKSKKSMKMIGNGEDLQYDNVIDCGKNTILVINQSCKEGKVIEISQKSNIIKTYYGNITNIQKLLSMKNNLIGMLCLTKCQLQNQLILQEIRIYDLNKNEFINKKYLDRIIYDIDQDSFSVIEDSIYIRITHQILKTNLILEWNYINNQEVFMEIVLKIDSMKFYSQFNRIVATLQNQILYNINQLENKLKTDNYQNILKNVTNFASQVKINNSEVEINGPQQLEVMDYKCKRLWSYQVDSSYKIIFEVIDNNQIALLNSNSYLDIYNIETNQLIQTIDFQILNYSIIKFDNKFNIFVAHNKTLNKQQIVIYKNQRLIFKQLLEGNVIKVQKFGKYIFLLYSNGRQSILNLALNKMININNTFVKDFIRHNQQIIMVEENIVKIMSIS